MPFSFPSVIHLFLKSVLVSGSLYKTIVQSEGRVKAMREAKDPVATMQAITGLLVRVATPLDHFFQPSLVSVLRPL